MTTSVAVGADHWRLVSPRRVRPPRDRDRWIDNLRAFAGMRLSTVEYEANPGVYKPNPAHELHLGATMTSPTTIDLTILHHVTGGNQQAQQQAAQAGLAHSQTCAAWVRSLAANRQLVPPSFPAACGTLRPDIQEGHKIKERGINTGIYESREPGTFW